MSQPQPYAVTIRNGGVPQTGLAAQLNSAQAAFNPLTGAPVGAGLPTWAEFGASGRYYVSGGYDAAANGPLHVNLDAGGTVSDPNERYTEIGLYADPALIAAASAQTTAAQQQANTVAALNTAAPPAPAVNSLYYQLVRVYGAEWGNITRNGNGSYSVTAPGTATVIGTTNPTYSGGVLQGTTKTVS